MYFQVELRRNANGSRATAASRMLIVARSISRLCVCGSRRNLIAAATSAANTTIEKSGVVRKLERRIPVAGNLTAHGCQYPRWCRR